MNMLSQYVSRTVMAAMLLVLSALWHLAYGSAREHPLAPCLAASICGFLAVGLFDSLLDVPRIAFLFHFLVLVAMVLRDPPPATRSPLVRHADPHGRA